MRPKTLLLISALVSIGPASALAQEARQAGEKARVAPKKDPSCQVEGVWQLESTKWGDGQTTMSTATGTRERKMLTKNHFMFLGADAKRDTIAMRTATDSLRAMQVVGGTGTYTVKGNTYTERVELFFIPSWEGRDVPATCETVGDRWTHTWKYDTTTVVEVWRRVRK